MSRLVGIDIRATHVRVAVLHTRGRRILCERLVEVDLSSVETLEQGLQASLTPILQKGDMLAVAVDGEMAFMHRLKLPATAQKQLAEVLPFELEAQVPVDIDELVFDYKLLHRVAPTDPISVLVAAARTEHVRARIALLSRAVGQEPDRVGSGPMPLANLLAVAPTLAGPGPIALVDLGGSRTEVALVAGGALVFARTLSRGVGGLPDSAPALAADLRQTFASWAAQGGESVQAAYLLGAGADAPGAIEYLSHEAGVPVELLPPLTLEWQSPEDAARAPRFAKAIALGLGLLARPRDLDLRRGPLAFQRGYGFLKEKAPVLVGLAAAVFISFLFSTWAQLRSLSEQHDTLTKALASLSREALGKQTTDGAEARDLLAKTLTAEGADPLPQVDAFDVIVEISKAVPMSVTHDIDEFDMQRGHVKINGVVGTTADAQVVSTELAKHRCFSDVKVGKISQVIGSDRQKYVLDFDVKCPGEASKSKKKAKSSEEGESESSPTEAP